ncbi:MAG: acyl-CoA dehydrogenase family protein [Burkholderiaceae bacterium]
MNFQLSDEQRQIKELARQFADCEILPRAVKADRLQIFPQEVQAKAIELGLLNLSLPESVGGAGLGCFEVVLVTEELCRACLGIGTTLCTNTLAAEPLLQGGSAQQQARYLTPLTKGRFASFAMSEPGAGSDVAGIRTRAEKVDGGWCLNGSKIWISNAPLADFFVVFAKTDAQAGHRGMTAFIVERDSPGLSIGQPMSKLGQRAAPTAEIFFDNIFIPDAQRLGEEGSGFGLAMQVFDHSRPMVAAFGVGLIQRCVDESLEYARTRFSMGKPLIEHQAIAHRLADMQIRLEAARLLTYQAAWLTDQGLRSTQQASIAKSFAADAAMWAATETIQIFGGMGYSTEYPVEKLFRDAKVLQIYEGTSEIQRNIIAREMARV